jgi:hypothetical protein
LLEYAPWEIQNDVLVFLPHQIYFRIKCGEAAFVEKLWVLRLSAAHLDCVNGVTEVGLRKMR